MLLLLMADLNVTTLSFRVSAELSLQQSRRKDLVASSGETPDCNQPLMAPLTVPLV